MKIEDVAVGKNGKLGVELPSKAYAKCLLMNNGDMQSVQIRPARPATTATAN